MMKKYNKIIVWGGKPYTRHTHGFAHGALYRAAQSMGIESYWLDNRDNAPESFFDNSIIVTEQWLAFENSHSNRLPLRPTSAYVVNYLGNKGPGREGNPGAGMYLGKVGRLIDYRFACDWGINGIEDKNYAYKFEKEKYLEIGGGSSYYEQGDDYDNFYAFWGTDLLPDEINFEDRFIPFAEPRYAFFGGSISDNWGNVGDGNAHLFAAFSEECKKADIAFYHNSPHESPLEIEQIRKTVTESYLPLDIRPENHLANNYVPCRSFKNTSYGQLVITNSKAVYDFFDGEAAYASDTGELFHVACEMQNDPGTKDKILNQMKKVKDKHTYVNRVNDIIGILEM
jgi:hypothetical protein